MKISYEFVTGERIEVEVEKEVGEVMMVIERETINLNRRETKRHNSINCMEEFGEELIDSEVDIFNEVYKNEESQKLYKALEELLPNQKKLIEDIFILEKKIITIAKEEGVTETAIRNRLKKIYKKLKIFLK